MIDMQFNNLEAIATQEQFDAQKEFQTKDKNFVSDSEAEDASAKKKQFKDNRHLVEKLQKPG